MRKRFICIRLYDFAFIMCIASIIIGSIRYFPDEISELLRYGFIIVSFMAILEKRTICITKCIVSKYIILYIIICCFSTLLSPYFSLRMEIALCQFILINIFVILFPWEKYLSAINIAMIVFYTICMISVVFSLILFYFGNYTFIDGKRYNYLLNPIISQRAMGPSGIRLGYSSFFSNPNSFGSYCVIALLWIMSKSKGILSKRNVISLFIMGTGVFLSNSRSAYFLSFIVVAFFLFVNIKDNNTKIFLVFISLTSFTLYLIMHMNKFVSVLMSVDLNGREEIWSSLMKSIREYPILGTGYSSGSKYIIPQEATGTYSSYLTILTDCGLIGAILSFSVLIHSLRDCVINVIQKNKTAIYLLAFTIYMCILGISENVFFNVTNRWLLWLLTCLSIIRNKSNN